VYSSIDEYYVMKLGLDDKPETISELAAIKEYFKDYKAYYDLYFNEDRKHFFSKPVELVQWFTEQNSRCGYCLITKSELKSELKSIVELRDGKLTLNGLSKRSKGTLEIERLKVDDGSTKDNGYSLDNCILACSLCNNAKSNLIDEYGWKTYFVEPMQKYYESILGRKLEFRKHDKDKKRVSDMIKLYKDDFNQDTRNEILEFLASVSGCRIDIRKPSCWDEMHANDGKVWDRYPFLLSILRSKYKKLKVKPKADLLELFEIASCIFDEDI